MRSTIARHAHRAESARLPSYARLARALFGFMMALLLMAGGTSAASAAAAPGSAGATLTAVPADGLPVRDDRQYVYTMGVLADVRRDTITLRFDDGQTQRFAVNTATTIHRADGEPQSVANLAVGEMVIVITEQDDTTAVTIVNSDASSFSASGPFDIGDGE